MGNVQPDLLWLRILGTALSQETLLILFVVFLHEEYFKHQKSASLVRGSGAFAHEAGSGQALVRGGGAFAHEAGRGLSLVRGSGAFAHEAGRGLSLVRESGAFAHGYFL